MKKTLLLTTALIGTLSVLGTANAEIKIGGGVKTAWKSAESKTTTGAAESGFSQERQIDFSSSGTLNNGMKYNAGFSMEQDAEDTKFDGGEGNYVSVTSGSTTFELGNDHIALNSDYNIVPRAGNAINEEIGTYGGLLFAQDGGKLKESMGLGVVQEIPTGKVMLNYYPKAQTTAIAQGDTKVANDLGTSGYEVAYGGKPMANLDVFANYRTRGKDGVETEDFKGKKAGFAYGLGSAKFGYEYATHETNGAETKMSEIGVVFKLSDNASMGIGQTKAELKTAAGVTGLEEKVNYLQIGYNLGAIGTQLSYIDTSDLGGNAAVDPKVLVLKVNTKF